MFVDIHKKYRVLLNLALFLIKNVIIKYLVYSTYPLI